MKIFFLTFFLVQSIFASSLQLVTSSNPSRLNPIFANDSASSQISSHIFSSLLKYDKNLNIVGDLALSYSFKDDTSLIFKLRKDVKWHDGKSFSAKDVKFTYDLINNPNIVSSYTATFVKVKSVEILDDYTIEVKYKEPYFKALEVWMMGIVPEHILKKSKDPMNDNFNKKPIGTGPYKLKSLEFSKNIELIANEDYYEGKPKIDKISYHIIADPMTTFLMLKSNKLDAGSLEAMQIERQVSKEFFNNFNVYEDMARAYTYLGFNLKRDKFKDPKVREALSLAIDRVELTKILFLGHASVCNGPFFPKSNAYNKDVKIPTQDIKKAKELLKQAGYTKDNPLEFEIATSNSNSTRTNAAIMIQQQLSKVGVKVTLRIMEWQAFLNMVVFPRNFDTVILGWSLSYTPDPYLIWHSDNDRKGGFNFVGYNNKEVDQLINKMQITSKPQELYKIQQEIFKKIVEDNPYLFLYIPNSIEVVSKKVKNITKSKLGIWHNYIKWEK